ncbi:MAG TPA: ATP-binding protein [Steroidobacteraceae bacterium]|nr:ATP-binding protein [Steroidobacteraceae bacterium]
MDLERELRPFRNLVYALALFTFCAVAILVAPADESPYMHTFFDAGIFVVSGVVAVLLWDMGWRTDDDLTRLIAVAIGLNAMFELIHVLPALEVSRDAVDAARLAGLVRPVTWPPAAFLLPIGLCAAYALRKRSSYAQPALAIGLLILGAVLLWIFDPIPPYTAPTWFGVTRPSLSLVPFLSLLVGVLYWRVRNSERLGLVIVLLTLLAVLSNIAMLYSEAPADRAAMLAHAGRFANGLFLLVTLTQMGSIDTARRIRAERDLTRLNEALEDRVRERTVDLEAANTALRAEAATREQAEARTLAQLNRLRLLQQTTHAIAERQDLASIFQVVVGSLENNLNADFACLCQYDQVSRQLTVARVGTRSAARAAELELGEQQKIDIADGGPGDCVRGDLVYEPDTAAAGTPFAKRLARCGLRSFVAVPLLVEQRSGVFGVLLVARTSVDGFSGSDREFLDQLGENVALASNQAQLHSALQSAYEELRDTQQAVMRQERLRALGQMASGIAHDINNAISPATLYVEAILERANGLDAKTRSQLETVQRAIGDVAQTVSRMGEFYRQGETKATLSQVNINEVLGQIPDLTRARWSDLAQARGVAIDMRVDKAPGTPMIMANESEIREALINLVFNAADALPDGGRITLRARRSAGDAPGAKPSTIVEVCDDGIGMDEDTRNHCLEPFFTTKGLRGTGLGLAMVYGIAQRHSAGLQIDSNVGKGTTIRLVFPDSEGAAAVVRDRAVTAAARGLRLLLIDDDPLILQSLRNALEFEGHYVMCADGGQAGIDMYRAACDGKQPFSAVITDLGMPHVDGRQVAAAIKAIEQTAKVIMLTGWGQLLADGSDAPTCVDRILSKPPNMWELREALSQAVEI